MTIIRLYYVTGTFLVLLTLVFFVMSVINFEDMVVFSLAGILLVALGIVQYMLKLQEKYHQIQLELKFQNLKAIGLPTESIMQATGLSALEIEQI